MLRAGLELVRSETPEASEPVWRVSSGSAAVLGLCTLAMDAAPTTAYLMLGDRCQRACAFCAQARDSQASADALSRVVWPPFAASQVAEAVAQAHDNGRIARACFQVTVHAGYIERALAAVAMLHSLSMVPICVSIAARTITDIAALLDAGAERVTLALDAATPTLYHAVKGGDWERAWDLLTRAAHVFPGRIGTHLIAGLGESEREMVERIQALHDLGVTIGLFALTPVRGSAWEGRSAPELESYRRIQAAHWLIVQGMARAEQMAYDLDGRIVDLGIDEETLRILLGDGTAFRTAGCPGCNRPYYNERPGGPLYNYPCALTPGDAQTELDALLATLCEDNSHHPEKG
jgi:lipoyl synthase